MHRVDTEGNDDGLFQDGNPQLGQQGTIYSADWPNDVQENLMAVLEEGGIEPEKGRAADLVDAIGAMIAAAVSSAAMAITDADIGIVKMALSTVLPANHKFTNGAAYLRADYPKAWTYAQASGMLAADAPDLAAHPGKWGRGDGATTFTVPDLRADWIRALDQGLGVDAGRGAGTHAGDQNKAHTHGVRHYTASDNTGADIAGATGTLTETAATESSGGAEVKVRSTALPFIVRVA